MAVKACPRQLRSTEKVTASGNDGNLDTLVDSCFDFLRNAAHNRCVNADGSPTKRFAGQFQKNSPLFATM
jgi:hypothetical protein